MLQPKRLKHQRQFRGKMRGISIRGSELNFGEYGLKSMECIWLTANQIESARKAIAHHTKRGGKIWTRVFPDKPISQKAGGSRMGSGKGDLKGYVAVVRPGVILFELAGVPLEVAAEAMRLAGNKLPIKTKFISSTDNN